MRPKNFSKKLNLNKKTIVNLEKPTMGKVYGGNTSIYVESDCVCDRVAIYFTDNWTCLR